MDENEENIQYLFRQRKETIILNIGKLANVKYANDDEMKKKIIEEAIISLDEKEKVYMQTR